MRAAGIGLLMVVFLLAGCGPRIIRLTEADRIENRHVVFDAPLGKWYLLGDREWSEYKGEEWIRIYKKDIPGVSYTVGIDTDPYEKKRWLSFLFDPEPDFEAYFRQQETDPGEIKKRKEMNITYERYYVAYVANLKCMGYVRAQGMVGLEPKDYSIYCGYYNTAGEKRVLGISYFYNTASGPWVLEKDKDRPRSEFLPPDKAEADLKMRVKHLIDSIQIKDLDRTRTKLYGQSFEMTQF